MKDIARFIGIDLGASGGRVLLGRWDGNGFKLEELHRFLNGPVSVLGHLYWDVLYLWAEIKTGLARYSSLYGEPLAGMGVDTWGVDFALIDEQGRLLGNPCHYRDPRTEGMAQLAFQRMPRKEIFQRTGIQFMQINTVFQLLSMVEEKSSRLSSAEMFLMIPDLFHYWLSGCKVTEYTNASTTQMLSGKGRSWDRELITRLGIPSDILPPITPPGTVMGNIRSDVAAEVGFSHPVSIIAPATHDTASAVAAIPNLDRNSAYISSGTWSLMGVELNEPLINEKSLSLNFTNEGGVEGTFRLLKNIAGLWPLQECKRIWQNEGNDPGWEQLLALAEQADAFQSLIDLDSPEFLSPENMPRSIRNYCKQTGQPEPSDAGAMVLCILESLALKYRWGLEALESLVGRRLDTIHIVGGGSRNDLLCQFCSNACDRHVIAGPAEATALGNIMVQAISTGFLPNITSGREAIAASIRQRHFEPRSVSEWQDAYSRFFQLIS